MNLKEHRTFVGYKSSAGDLRWSDKTQCPLSDRQGSECFSAWKFSRFVFLQRSETSPSGPRILNRQWQVANEQKRRSPRESASKTGLRTMLSTSCPLRTVTLCPRVLVVESAEVIGGPAHPSSDQGNIPLSCCSAFNSAVEIDMPSKPKVAIVYYSL